MKKLQKTHAVQATTMVVCLLIVSTADAEIRTITATGEYRMGDNDTRTDAKRLALLDAKRLALEEAGTYIESITQVKNFDLSKEEIRAYTAGIVEVTEQAARDVMEGTTHIVRVDVKAKIDTDLVARQIDALRKNETVKAELLHARAEAERLRQERDALRQELAAAKSKPEVDALAQKRREVLTGADVNSLLAQARVALGWSSEGFIVGTSSSAGRARARSLIEQALALDPSEPGAHHSMGVLLAEEGDLDGAIAAYRTALRLKPDYAVAHNNLGLALKAKGDLDGAIAAYRTALRLQPEDAVAHHNLGFALTTKGDLEGAIAEHRVALRLKPDYADAHFGMGLTLLRKGDLEGAIAEYRIALRLKPDIAAFHYSLGTALHAKWDLEGAIAEYRTAVRLKPDWAEAHHNLGAALYKKGDLDGA
ncbi:MAG: tetratricopeptide repeat protein, partial [Methyloceanibacter sp.]